MPSESSRNTEIEPLDLAIVLFIHLVGIDIVFEGYGAPGELRGLRGDGSLLLGALEQPFQTFDGQELYPGLLDKAAALIYFLTNDHPFVDRNKRTALLSAILFLEINGYELNATEKELVRLMREVAYGKKIPAIKKWLRQHVVRTDQLAKRGLRDVELSRRRHKMLKRLASWLSGGSNT